LHINAERLKASMDQINEIEVTEEGGMNRLALTDSDKQARDLLKKWMEEAGLEVRIDDMGTMYGRRPGTDPNALPVCLGSHMDTQPNGGKYDGLLGVMGPLEVIRSLNDNNVHTKHPIEVINWTNEEGARFEPPLLASGVVAGIFESDWVYGLKSPEGKTYLEELQRIGYQGDRNNRLKNAKALVEMHIEQGPVMEADNQGVGVVKGILGITWLEITIKGEADHAGPSPMSLRHDALMAASKAIVGIRERILRHGDPVVATVGRITTSTSTINIIPGTVTFTLDIRHKDSGALDDLETEVNEVLEQVCQEEGTSFKINRLWNNSPTHFDETVVNTIGEAAKSVGLPDYRIISGAGHDAKYIAEIIPAGMIFVRSMGGKSHCPEELSSWDDIALGTEVLYESVLRLVK